MHLLIAKREKELREDDLEKHKIWNHHKSFVSSVLGMFLTCLIMVSAQKKKIKISNMLHPVLSTLSM